MSAQALSNHSKELSQHIQGQLDRTSIHSSLNVNSAFSVDGISQRTALHSANRPRAYTLPTVGTSSTPFDDTANDALVEESRNSRYSADSTDTLPLGPLDRQSLTHSLSHGNSSARTPTNKDFDHDEFYSDDDAYEGYDDGSEDEEDEEEEDGYKQFPGLDPGIDPGFGGGSMIDDDFADSNSGFSQGLESGLEFTSKKNLHGRLHSPHYLGKSYSSLFSPGTSSDHGELDTDTDLEDVELAKPPRLQMDDGSLDSSLKSTADSVPISTSAVNTVSGFSGEDDSDIEEELEQAAQQIKHKSPNSTRRSSAASTSASISRFSFSEPGSEAGTIPNSKPLALNSGAPEIPDTSLSKLIETPGAANTTQQRRRNEGSTSSKWPSRQSQTLEVITQGSIIGVNDSASQYPRRASVSSSQSSTNSLSQARSRLTPELHAFSSKGFVSNTTGGIAATLRSRRGTDGSVNRLHSNGNNLNLPNDHIRSKSNPTSPATLQETSANRKLQYSEETLAAQANLEIGLGLRNSQTCNISNAQKPHETHSSRAFLSPASNSEKKDNVRKNSYVTISEESTHNIASLNASPRKTNKSNFVIKKRNISNSTSSASKPSILTSKIQNKLSGLDDPLDQYVEASGKSDRRPLRLKIYMPSCAEPQKPWDVVVRPDVNVSLTIGFALFCYQNENRQPPLDPDLCNANKWTLRIVEDDGEPDEDFPALDRTRLISKYGFDEFALVQATPAQFAENEKATPSARTRKATNEFKQESPSKLSSKNADPSNISTSVSSFLDSEDGLEESQKAVLKIYQYPYDDMVSKLYWSAEVDMQVTISEVLYQVCLDKNLDRTKYVLKLAGKRSIFSMSQTFTNIKNTELNKTEQRHKNKSKMDSKDSDSDESDFGTDGPYPRPHLTSSIFGQTTSLEVAGVGAQALGPQYVDLPNFEITPKRVITRANGYNVGPEDLKAVAGESIVPFTTATSDGGRRSYESDRSFKGSSQSNRNSVYLKRSSVQHDSVTGGLITAPVVNGRHSEEQVRTKRHSINLVPNSGKADGIPNTIKSQNFENNDRVSDSSKMATGSGSIGAGSSVPLSSSSAALAARKRLRASIVPVANPETLGTAGFHRYKIWRRQPMSFISRHERIMTLDGEYVHIIPAEDPAWYDSLKTSSFHISQLINCKVSRKIPENFKVVIMKTSGSKRYDLEAPNSAIAAEIVSRIKSLYNRYNLKHNASLGVGPGVSLPHIPSVAGSVAGAHKTPFSVQPSSGFNSGGM